MFIHTAFANSKHLRMPGQLLKQSPVYPIFQRHFPRMYTYRIKPSCFRKELIFRKTNIQDCPERIFGQMMRMYIQQFHNQLRYRVISGTTPGMATQYTFYRQIKAFERAMFLNSLNCILRTGRSKSARRGSHGRNALPVKINRKQQQI